MSKRFFVIILVALLLAMTVAACGAQTTPEPTPSPETNVQLKPISVGLVTAVGGIEEKFYSALAWKGIQQAENLLTLHASYKESQSEDDFVAYLDQFASENTDLTITIGKEMSDAVSEVAQKHPDADFAIVDADSNAPNVRGITFDIIPPSYMAGYLAAGMTQTGVVCTYGAADIEAITDYMTGFYNGADYYRRTHGTNLDILGWDVYKKEGVFLQDKTSEEEGYQVAKDFFAKDCDVIFAVAKNPAKGSAKAAQEANKMFIGATVDWYQAFPEYGNVVLTSVMKDTQKAVFDNVVAYAAGTAKGGENYVGTLENGGVELAPYHLFEGKIPQSLQEEVNLVKNSILTGHIDPAEPWVLEEGKSE